MNKNQIHNILYGYRYWKQKGYNPFNTEEKWEHNENGKLISPLMEEDMDRICKMYPPLTRECINYLAGESQKRHINRIFR